MEFDIDEEVEKFSKLIDEEHFKQEKLSNTDEDYFLRKEDRDSKAFMAFLATDTAKHIMEIK